MVCYGLIVQIQITDWIWILSQGNLTTFFIRSQEKQTSSKKLPCEVIPQGGHKYGFPPFRHLTFRQETFQYGHFITRTFRHVHVLALRTYRHMDVSSPWTFQHKDFSAQRHFGRRNFRCHGRFGRGYFGNWKFRHMDIWVPCKAILTYRHKHFGTCATVPIYPCAKMSLC